MATTEQIEVLFQEIGPATEEVTGVYQDGPEIWRVIVHDTTEVELLFDPEQEKLVLSCAVGSPPEDRRLKTYELLLVYNYAWQQTGGIRMALEGPEGEVALMFELNASDLSLQLLQTVIVNFADRAELWREVVAVGAGEMVEEKPEMFSNFIRI